MTPIIAVNLTLLWASQPTERLDHKLLQGNWKVVCLAANGQPISHALADAGKNKVAIRFSTVGRWIVRGNELSVALPWFPDRKVGFKLDASELPKAIKLNGDLGGMSLRGHYILRGNVLWIATGPGSRQFATAMCQTGFYVILEREKAPEK